jgi:hypothetical protein
MINSLGPVAGAEAVDQRGRLLIAGYAVKRLSASLSPRDRRESGRAVPRGAHRARSALSASRRESAAEARAARETLGVLGRNGEAPSDRSLGASVYRPSPSVGDERKMARGSMPLANRVFSEKSGHVNLNRVGQPRPNQPKRPPNEWPFFVRSRRPGADGAPSAPPAWFRPKNPRQPDPKKPRPRCSAGIQRADRPSALREINQRVS